MVKHAIYQKRNLLNEADFSILSVHKDSVINKQDSFTIIRKDGTIEKPKLPIGKVSNEGITNFKLNVEEFANILGDPFVPAFNSIQNFLTELGAVNPKPYSCRVYRHNKPYIPWHKHKNIFKVDPSNFWISIFYLHPNWDIKYGGQLRVGVIDTEDLSVFECYSNSVVVHNGYYGHGVKKVIQGFENNRDILLIHWISGEVPNTVD